MIYKAYHQDIQKFLSLPETGMGYQVVEAKRHGQAYKYVVYNGELIVDFDSQFNDYRKQIIAKGFPIALNEAGPFLGETNTISLIPRNTLFEVRSLSESKKNNKHRHSGDKGAKDNTKENANREDIFVRISAYENDKRIDFVNKKLKEGSHTTTFYDYRDCVSYDDDPIDRYSLPNDETIKWAFYLQPKSNDILQKGIVQSAFGHDGGGVEVYFEKGTSDNTYFAKRTYGK